MNSVPSLKYDPALELRKFRSALIWGLGMPGCRKNESVPPYLKDILDLVQRSGEGYLPPERKKAVREILRFGSYKPSGRSKPSSEYLLSAALEGGFPLVNSAVDVNNALSLESGYPASIFDLDRCGTELLLRRGKEGESYVFNPSGQVIELKDLLCVCRKTADGWFPCGNPVKDSMETKTTEATSSVVAVIYAPLSEPEDYLSKAAAKFASLLKSECGAEQSGTLIE